MEKKGFLTLFEKHRLFNDILWAFHIENLVHNILFRNSTRFRNIYLMSFCAERKRHSLLI